MGCAGSPIADDSNSSQKAAVNGDPNGGSNQITTDPGTTTNEGGCGLSIEAGAGNPDTCDHGRKTLVCHIPPGNPSNAHTICISPHAVQAHIDHHGDRLGRCEDQNECDFDSSSCGGSQCETN